MTPPQSRLLKLADEAVADYNAMHAAGGEAIYPSWVEDVRLLCNAAPGVSTVEKRRPARDWELTCHECDGSGHVYVKHQVAERKTDVQEFKEECECCEGRGFVFAFQDIPGIEEYVKACRPAPAGVSTVEAVDTQNLRKLLERATPGPWTWKQVGTFSTPGVALFWPDTSKGGVHYRRLDSNGGITEADAELITNAVRALPALLDEALAAQRKGDA